MTDEQPPEISVRLFHNGEPVADGDFLARSGDTYVVHHAVNVDDDTGRPVLRRTFEIRLEFSIPLQKTKKFRVIDGGEE